MRYLIVILLSASLLLAQETTIIKSEGSHATIEPQDLPLGISGIVIHTFNPDLRSIIARAILVAPDRIRFEVFDALAQESLPRPAIKPRPGDRVILGYLDDRALIIAPNLGTYQVLAQEFEGYDLLHPDLFAAELSKAKHPAPSKEDFKNFCNKFALSTIFLALKDRTLQLDCYSFTPLRSYPIAAKTESLQLPFYSRVKEIESSIFDFFGDNEIKDYFEYYQMLVESK
ncbi:MAG: hypothetical protein GXO16_01365 [Epsilonproteobacteria bacterium]|nr:hypothetical protein [Campylobacterota bacterium]